MNKFIFSILLGCAVLAAQPGINNRAVRDIRLQNLKRDYTGSTIRFIIPGSISVMGLLKDVTDKNFIISHNGSPAVYSHEEINYIFIDPGFTGKLMAFGVGLLGGAAGYMAVIISKENANASWKGVVSSLGVALGGRIGFKTFFKPIKIDISGKTRE
tara:strand:- start:141 stop:611 length:471 start_codon:yes stop_codon:yes gene_type:complete